MNHEELNNEMSSATNVIMEMLTIPITRVCAVVQQAAYHGGYYDYFMPNSGRGYPVPEVDVAIIINMVCANDTFVYKYACVRPLPYRVINSPILN